MQSLFSSEDAVHSSGLGQVLLLLWVSELFEEVVINSVLKIQCLHHIDNTENLSVSLKSYNSSTLISRGDVCH